MGVPGPVRVNNSLSAHDSTALHIRSAIDQAPPPGTDLPNGLPAIVNHADSYPVRHSPLHPYELLHASTWPLCKSWRDCHTRDRVEREVALADLDWLPRRVGGRADWGDCARAWVRDVGGLPVRADRDLQGDLKPPPVLIGFPGVLVAVAMGMTVPAAVFAT
jgi:hypothetical protein